VVFKVPEVGLVFAPVPPLLCQVGVGARHDLWHDADHDVSKHRRPRSAYIRACKWDMGGGPDLIEQKPRPLNRRDALDGIGREERRHQRLTYTRGGGM
jgi:hypothetical protein